jgi:hypothetical protein
VIPKCLRKWQPNIRSCRALEYALSSSGSGKDPFCHIDHVRRPVLLSLDQLHEAGAQRFLFPIEIVLEKLRITVQFGREIKTSTNCALVSQQLLADMMESPIGASLGTHLMFCIKNLERMGDHATNIAESVHYMVKGETLLRERPKADFTSMLTGGPVFAPLTPGMTSGASATNSAAYL